MKHTAEQKPFGLFDALNVNGVKRPSEVVVVPVDPNVRSEDRPRLTGQNAQVLAWLEKGEYVTVRMAFEAGIQRLAARVCDLREAKYPVKGDYLNGVMTYWMDTERSK